MMRPTAIDDAAHVEDKAHTSMFATTEPFFQRRGDGGMLSSQNTDTMANESINNLGTLANNPIEIDLVNERGSVEDGSFDHPICVDAPVMSSAVNAETLQESFECPICFEPFLLSFGAKQSIAAPPNCLKTHHFHGGCLGRWLRKNKFCPICRAPVADFLSCSLVSFSRDGTPTVNLCGVANGHQ